MGLMCCKAKTEEGLTYDDNDFGNFYNFNNNNNNNNSNTNTANFFAIDSTVKAGGNTNPKYIKELDKQDVESVQGADQMNISMANKPDNIKAAEAQRSFNSETQDRDKKNANMNILADYNNNSRTASYENNNRQYVSSTFQRASFNTQSNGLKEYPQTSDFSVQRELKLLKLVIKESKFNQVNQELRINNNGLVGSTRNANDGVVLFGQRVPGVVNDFILQQEEGINAKHFEIKYEKTLNDYYIKNIKGSGVFIRIENEITVRDGMIISFGTNHIVVKVATVDNDQTISAVSKITFKAIYGPNKGSS